MPARTTKKKPAKRKPVQGKSGKGKPAKGRPTKGKAPKRKPPRKRRSKTAEPAVELAGTRPTRKRTSRKVSAEAGERLQKVMASAGIGSRRECEQLILEGRVDVDGEIVAELGTRVDLSKQTVRFDGHELKARRLQYFVLNKPVDVVCTNRDPERRLRVIDLIPGEKHIFTVGRLDRASEGLILVTNDGELANRLAHPRYEIEKVYRVNVVGQPDPKELAKLRKGVWIAEGKVHAADLKIKSRRKNHTELEMVLTEGRNREIRRMLARIGHKVVRLRRIAMGPIRLGELPVGAHRELTFTELRNLKKIVAGEGNKKPTKRRSEKKSIRSKSGSSPRSRPAKKKSKARKPKAKPKQPGGRGRRK